MRPSLVRDTSGRRQQTQRSKAQRSRMIPKGLTVQKLGATMRCQSDLHGRKATRMKAWVRRRVTPHIDQVRQVRLMTDNQLVVTIWLEKKSLNVICVAGGQLFTLFSHRNRQSLVKQRRCLPGSNQRTVCTPARRYHSTPVTPVLEQFRRRSHVRHTMRRERPIRIASRTACLTVTPNRD